MDAAVRAGDGSRACGGPGGPVEEARARLHRLVDEEVERMTGGAGEGVDPYTLDFTGRETMAVEIGRRVAATMLELNVREDPGLRAAEEAATWVCPRCGRSAPRAKDEAGRPRRELTPLKTRGGTVAMDLPLFRCGGCRVSFSPLPAEREPGAGGL